MLFANEMLLSRIDIKYSRNSKRSDLPGVEIFLERCRHKLLDQSRRLSVSLGRSVKGCILRIGSRRGANHYRIYEDLGSLEFELEIKNRALPQFQKLFFEYDFLKFEMELVDYFCKYSKKYLIEESCYMDWLAEFLREKSAHEIEVFKTGENNFVVDYIQKRTLTSQANTEYFYRLLQLLSFLHAIKKTSYELDTDLVYHKFEFKIVDFLAYTGQENTRYQVKKTAIFLESLLHLDPVTTMNFSDKSYRRFVCFPTIQVKKVGKYLTVRVVIIGDLYDHCYPFLLPENFMVANTKHDINVKLELLNALTQMGVEKVFKCEAFLNKYNLSNRKKSNIKKLIIDGFLSLIESGKIEKRFTILTKNDLIIEKDALIVELLNQSHSIYFYEKL